MPISKKTLEQIRYLINADTDNDLNNLADSYQQLRESFLEWVTFWMHRTEHALQSNNPVEWQKMLKVIHGSMLGTIQEMEQKSKNYLSDPHDPVIQSPENVLPEREVRNVLPDESRRDNSQSRLD